jgi:hypothetical protein
MSSNEFSDCEDTKLHDELQELFDDGDNDDETIIVKVFDHIISNFEILKNKIIVKKLAKIIKDKYNFDKILEDKKDEILKLKEKDHEFDVEYVKVFNRLKPRFDVEVRDETFRCLKRKNLEIEDEKDFESIREDVYDTIANYGSVICCHDNVKGEHDEYIKSEEYKYLVNRESMRQYREYKRCKKSNDEKVENEKEISKVI